MAKKFTRKIYMWNDLEGFESKVLLGHISYNTEEEFDREFKDILTMFGGSCHTHFQIVNI